MKYVFLKGKANVGKTTALQLLIAYFRKRNANTEEAIVDKEGYEYAVVLSYQGIKIGINTQGDIEEHITARHKWFTQNDCDICFGAMRTKGDTLNAVEKLKKENEVYVLHKLAIEANRFEKLTNDAQVQVMLEIFSAIK